MKSKFKINGLDCANCASELERAIQKLEGIKSANINFMAQKMELEYNEEIKEEIIAKVKKVIKKEEPDVTIEEVHETVPMKKRGIKIILAGILFFIALAINFNNKLINNTIYIISYAIVGLEIVKKAIRNITKGKVFDENFLMAVATLGAFGIGEFPEAVAVKIGRASCRERVSSPV